MIRVKYSNDSVQEYSSVELAKFMVSSILFASLGTVYPIEATEVFGVTTGGVSVEKDLKIKWGAVEFE